MKKIVLDSLGKSHHRGFNFRNLLYNNEARAFFFQVATFLIMANALEPQDQSNEESTERSTH